MTGLDWLAMEPEDFGGVGPDVLFDASDLTRGPVRFGQFEMPDLFASLDDQQASLRGPDAAHF